CRDWAVRSSQRHLEPDLGGVADLNPVNETQFIDVDWNLGIVTCLKTVNDLQLQYLFLHRIHSDPLLDSCAIHFRLRASLEVSRCRLTLRAHLRCASGLHSGSCFRRNDAGLLIERRTKRMPN